MTVKYKIFNVASMILIAIFFLWYLLRARARKIKQLKIFYRQLNRYLRYYDKPMIEKIIVLSLMAERKIFNLLNYPRTKIRNYFINRVYKKHSDHHQFI